MKSRLFRRSATERERLFEQIATDLAARPDVAFAYALGSSLTEPAFHDIGVALYLSGPAADHSGPPAIGPAVFAPERHVPLPNGRPSGGASSFRPLLEDRRPIPR